MKTDILKAYSLLGMPLTASQQADLALDSLLHFEKAKHKELVEVHGKTKTFTQLREVGSDEVEENKELSTKDLWWQMNKEEKNSFLAITRIKNKEKIEEFKQKMQKKYSGEIKKEEKVVDERIKRVEHLRFGQGTIVEDDGEKIIIDFDTVGRKELLKKFANLKGLEGENIFQQNNEEKIENQKVKKITKYNVPKVERIIRETERAYLLERNDIQFWIQKKWVNKEGKLTISGEESYNKKFEEEKDKKPVYSDSFKIIKQSDSGKASLISTKINDGMGIRNINFYVPNSTLSEKDGKVGIKGDMLRDKLKDLRDKYGKMSVKFDKETEKAYGISMYIEDYHTERELKRMIWIPKTQVKIGEEKDNIIVPSWMIEKKIEEEVGLVKTGAYQYVNLGSGLKREHKYLSLQIVDENNKVIEDSDNTIEKSIEDTINPNGGENIEKEAKIVKNKKQYVDGLLFNEKDQLLILRRTLFNDFAPKQWCLPGGHVDIGEKPEDAVIREVFEETNLEVTNAELVYIYEDEEVKIYYYECEYIPSEPILDNAEHSNYVWTNIWMDYDLLKNLKKNLEEIIPERVSLLENKLMEIVDIFADSEGEEFEKGMQRGGKLNTGKLVKKTIVDKTGKRTTKWVLPNQPEPQKKEKKQEVEGQKKEVKVKEGTETPKKNPEDHAKETKTEDLVNFMEKHKDKEELRKIAETEIKNRKDGKSQEPKETAGKKVEGEKETKKPVRKPKFYDELHKKYQLDRLPVGIPQEKVIVNQTDPLNHWVMQWEDPKSKKQMNSYAKVFLERNAKEKWDRVLKIKPLQIKSVKEKAIKLLSDKDKSISQSAAIIAIISNTGLRPGDKALFKKSGNRGISTLSPDNIEIKGDEITFNFIGKAYHKNNASIKNKELAEYLQKLKEQRKGKEFLFDVTKNKIVDVYRNTLGFKGFKLKDMRTYVACSLAKDVLFGDKTPPPPLPKNKNEIKKLIADKMTNVCEIVAQKLNNSAAMARSSYIHPQIFQNWLVKLGVAPDLIQKAITLEDIIKENKHEKL